MLGHRGVISMTGKQLKALVCSAFVLLLSSLVSSQRAVAQSQNASQNSASPLVRVLQAKGILTAEEVAQLSQASSASDADSRLAKLLLNKGIISQADYNQMLGAPGIVNASASNPAPASMIPAVYRVPVAGASAPPASSAPSADPAAVAYDAQGQTGQTPVQQLPSVSPTTLSAANPIRVFPVGGIPKGELKPAIKLAGIGITPY